MAEKCIPEGAEELRRRIISSLRAQGFRVRDGEILPPKELSKDRIRKLHDTAVAHRKESMKGGLVRKEGKLLHRIASGAGIDPMAIRPRLVEVRPDSENELLFRWAGLHWSIPVSSGYGRRLRFLVIDEQNGSLIGIIGLADPVFSLDQRDKWIGWTTPNRLIRLKNVMDAFVLGAVPPYSFLLFGKLVAMLATSDTVRHAFHAKYVGARSVIKQEPHDGRLAMITTTSALGRSSIYNRLRLAERLLYQSVGYTKGSGEFHFSNGLYEAISDFAKAHCLPTARHERWGIGFRNKRELIKKCLPVLGISSDWVFHGVEREIFVVPLASNACEFLRCEQDDLEWYHQSEDDIFGFFRERWLLPRLAKDERFRAWSKEDWILWPERGDERG